MVAAVRGGVQEMVPRFRDCPAVTVTSVAFLNVPAASGPKAQMAYVLGRTCGIVKDPSAAVFTQNW